MAWEHLSITQPHLVYIILGGFTSLFMLCSSVVKERLYIGEATVATICGLIVGPHAANLIDPISWGNTDIVTIEFSRIVLVVQCFAVGVELPKFYMERHWRSVLFLLLPVMTVGWLITSLFVWWMVPPLGWLESLVVAACVTATDPVLASSVVGKGKFAKRVPKHLRDLLSAESGCNDGMAFPFIYLSLYLIQDHQNARDVSFHWIVYTILYECIFGAVFGFLVGFFARHGIKYAESHSLIDRESFLVFYFVLALFCAGSGSILGVDDLLVGFACGVGFSNDGWFSEKTEQTHVSDVIDLLLNLTYFVYLGTVIPWEQFNNVDLGLSAWRLTIIAIFVILFRRIPIMMALKPFIPDVKTWREALFAGHFGPIGVGAIFVAIVARAELEHGNPVPLAELPDPSHENYVLLSLVWPIVTFLVIASIIVHGSSVAVFTLGRHINTLTLTMSYTKANEDGPSWMNRLPRITSISRSQARTMSDTDADDLKMPEYPPGTLPPVGIPGQFLRRVREDDKGQDSRASSIGGRKRKKKWDDGLGPGGPISQSAIFPQRRSQSEISGRISSERPSSGLLSPLDAISRGRSREREAEGDAEEDSEQAHGASGEQSPSDGDISPRRRSSGPQHVEVYDEGGRIVIEDANGEVLAVEPSHHDSIAKHAEDLRKKLGQETAKGMSWDAIKKRIGNWRAEEANKREKQSSARKHGPARAYQFGNTIIVEDEDGEVVKKYELPISSRPEGSGAFVSQGLRYMGMGNRGKGGERPGDPDAANGAGPSNPSRSPTPGESSTQRPWKKGNVEEEEADSRHIRFTINGEGQRMTEDEFIKEMQKFDRPTRKEIVDHSSASNAVKTLAKQDSKTLPLLQTSQARSSGKSPAAQVTLMTGKTKSAVDKDESRSEPPARREGWSRAKDRSPSPRTVPDPKDDDAPSRSAPETAVERRRRLAVLEDVGSASVADKKRAVATESGETPAERRRREAALGVSSEGAGDEEDSDDDDTPRMPRARRGIRFADAPERERR